MGRQEALSPGADLDLGFLDGFSELQVAPSDLPVDPRSSAASSGAPEASELAKPSKGQRYRRNKKVRGCYAVSAEGFSLSDSLPRQLRDRQLTSSAL